MKTNILLAAVTVFALGPLTSECGAQDSGGFKLKNRSVFNVPESVHNPFWPIGWVKPAERTQTDQTLQQGASGVEFKPDDFVITSILLNQPALAVINGKAYSEGQLFVVNTGTAKVTMRVQAIEDGTVTLRYQGRDIVCPLKRKEPTAHGAEPVPAQEAAILDNSLTIPK